MDTSFRPIPELPPRPRRVLVDTVKAQLEALDDLVARAKRTISVFDADLSAMEWNTVARCEQLTSFLRGSRDARLQIIVHDTRYLEARCARILALQRYYGHAITLRKTGDGAAGARDPLMLVDERHYLHRFDFEQPRAALVIDDPEATGPLAQRFDEIWATGVEAVPGTRLGL